MADELQAEWTHGVTIYFLVRSSVGTIYNGATYTAYVSANYSEYPVSATEQGSSGYYVGNMPSSPAGTYNVVAKLQSGGSPAESDITIGEGTIVWDGAEVPGGLLSLASNGLDNITVETGLNPRQALALISAACAGVLAGAATTNVTIAAANNSGTNRITATVDSNGDRSAITLNIPA